MFSKKPPLAAEEEVIVDPFSISEEDSVQSSIEPVPPAPQVLTRPSIISEGFEFVGTITSEGTLIISGSVKGKITARFVLVDVEGQVEGELNADSLMIKGKVVGDVQCQDLNVGPRAFVDGSISYQNIHIQRGGKIAGKFIKN